MMIKYSIAIRKTHPGDATSTETKAYGVVQISDKMDIREFSQHIANHGSVFTRDVVQGVLTKAVDCMRELMLKGTKIELGDLGCFTAGIKTEGAATASEFTADNIKKVYAVWDKSSYFDDMTEDATFELVPSRKAQAQAVAVARQQETKS